MKLSRLATVAGARLEGDDVEVFDLAYDSRDVTEGCLFFCLPGRSHDGHDFAADAVTAGASALVVSRDTHPGIPRIVVPDVREAMSIVAPVFFGEPSRNLQLFGVTGTNGKTTVSFMVESIATAAGYLTGLIGTVKSMVAGREEPGIRTTPESVDVQRLLAEMVTARVGVCAMEVTSVGIAEGRVEGCWFDLVAFTNLSQDHLDYHGDMQDYYAAKRALFEPERARMGLINVDDPAGRKIHAETNLKSSTYGVDHEADFRAVDVHMRPNGSAFRVRGPGIDLEASIRLPGPFNVSNALCAATACHLMGMDHGAIAEGLQIQGVPGRFEAVDEGQPFAVVVDYAHTPDSLSNVLAAARSLGTGRLIVVFGCGGDRDRAKRPMMGQAAGSGADLVIATSDNPRSEDPDAILAQIEDGLRATTPRDGYRIVADRRQAITDAIDAAAEGDVVVIAGKGHETGQEVAGVKLPFDDRLVAAEILRGRA